jgi:hypothetical protein
MFCDDERFDAGRRRFGDHRCALMPDVTPWVGLEALRLFVIPRGEVDTKSQSYPTRPIISSIVHFVVAKRAGSRISPQGRNGDATVASQLQEVWS